MSKKSAKDLEASINRANKRAKELGLTLYLDPAKITISNDCPFDMAAEYEPEADNLVIYNRCREEDISSALVHEGCHQKFAKKIVPFCHPYNTKGQSYRHSGNCTLALFDEGLAYATDLITVGDTFYLLDFVRSNLFRERDIFAFYLLNRVIISNGNWYSPELSYAMMGAHKSGMSMDELFNKTKEFLAEPHEEFSFYEVAQFIKNELNQDPIECFELGKSKLTGELQHAKEELKKKLKEGKLEDIAPILDKIKEYRGTVLSLAFLKDTDPKIIDEYYTEIIDFYNKNPTSTSFFTGRPIYGDIKPAKVFQNKLRKEFHIQCPEILPADGGANQIK